MTYTAKSRYRIYDMFKGKDIDSMRASGEPRWTILDRETNTFVDEALTQYEARLALQNWKAGPRDA